MALRVKLEPDFRTARNGLAVLGAQVRLTAFGPGSTAAAKDQAKPATLIFCGAYIENVRDESNPALEAFAKVQGELKLSGPTRQAAMVLQGEEIEHDEPPPDDDDDGPPPYQLRIVYHAESFSGSPEPGSPLTVLRLPTAPEDARFFELGIELQIDGAAEGGSDVNDRVDVPLSTTTFFDVQLIDHKDFPLDNERYELELFDGSTLTGVTDEEGRVRLNPIPEGRCVLTLPEVVQGPEEGPESEPEPESESESEDTASADA